MYPCREANGKVRSFPNYFFGGFADFCDLSVAENLLFCSTAVQLIPQAYDSARLKTDRWLA